MAAPNGSGGVRTAAAAPDLEAALARIPDVRAARVVLDADGAVEEAHVLAGTGRDAKHISRDVQSALAAGFGLKIDYRTVSVARLDDDAAPPAAGGRRDAARPALLGVGTNSRGQASQVTVDLAVGGSPLSGCARGPAGSALALAARAVVDALEPHLAEAAPEVLSASIVTQAGESVALIVLRITTPREPQTVSGSALARKEPLDAVARATLSALNRIVRW